MTKAVSNRDICFINCVIMVRTRALFTKFLLRKTQLAPPPTHQLGLGLNNYWGRRTSWIVGRRWEITARITCWSTIRLNPADPTLDLSQGM